uniref:Uncharacterized protein n=1 Tax=Oryza punctata TaxID=4537 RepID=A0A0E0LIB0_ORYPU
MVKCNRLHLITKSNKADGNLLSNPPTPNPIYFLPFAHYLFLTIPQWGGSTPSSPLSGGSGFARIRSAGTVGECISCTRMFSPARMRMFMSCGRSSLTRTVIRLS